jgi:hypothetical protein
MLCAGIRSGVEEKTKTPSELVRLNHVARFIVHANHSIVRRSSLSSTTR